MERTEIVSLYKNTPADGTVVTVCGWAKNIRGCSSGYCQRTRKYSRILPVGLPFASFCS